MNIEISDLFNRPSRKGRGGYRRPHKTALVCRGREAIRNLSLLRRAESCTVEKNYV
jgi:hypothetical protein